MSLWKNSESWHGTKINKYLVLKTIIESKDWCMELFVVELVLGDTALNFFYAA